DFHVTGVQTCALPILGRGFGAYTSVLLALAAWFLGSCSKPVTDSMSRAAEPEGSSATESASPKPTSEIATGDELPEVAAISQTGANVSLRGFPDRVVLLFLCQSIASTRCTNLAAALSERFDQVRELDAAVIGVTTDHRAVLRESAFELELPYYVLADPERR